ncbi:GNAT family N-acetyltransferase [Viridibacterium curvum]|uniref:GNAT family N-acetyltransferase n=1 Tax=Viridibacterium curvum TaxID=1101404 RepID=A0ABP9QA32_9RHOO
MSTATPGFRLVPHIREIPPMQWDALHDGQCFVRHAFLAALEASGSVGAQTGWTPAHATLWDGDTLIAAAPAYLKTHSWGEYVFDWAWAEAYERHGLPYYPKWLCAIPFSPVPGARLLARDETARRQLLAAMLDQAIDDERSSLHLLFCDAASREAARAAGLMLRHNVQFHWQNRGYGDFEHFLASLAYDKRKKIRQERRKVTEAGVVMATREGRHISDEDWDFFYRCHTMTYALHGGRPYLTRAFFRALADSLPECCVMIIASRDGQPVASSLLLRDTNVLYGRYWGAMERISCLHFEACYYTPIEYAITQGLHSFEGGAQGEHKLARGLDPVDTHSLHWIADADFRDAIGRFLQREADGMARYVDELGEHTAYRHAQGQPQLP